MSSIVYIIGFTIAGLLFIMYGLYILRLNPANVLHRTFFLVSVILLISCVAGLVIQFKTVSEYEVFRHIVTVIGTSSFMWTMYLLLMFYIVLTMPVKPSWIIWSIFALIPAYLTIKFFTMSSIATYTLVNEWLQFVSFHEIFDFMNVYFGIYLLLIIALIIRWYKKDKSKKVRKQAILLMFAPLITIILIMVDTFLLFHLIDVFEYKTPGATTFYFIIWFIGIGYATEKLRLIQRTGSRISSEVLGNIEQSVILLSDNYKVRWISDGFVKLLDGTKSFIGSDLKDLVLNFYLLEKELEQLNNGGIKSVSVRISFLAEEDVSLTLESKIKILYDEFQEMSGYLITAEEVKNLAQLKRLFRITSREGEIIQGILNGKTNLEIARELYITERTVKAHVTNIFNKTVVDNRVQLIMKLREHNLLPQFTSDRVSLINR